MYSSRTRRTRFCSSINNSIPAQNENIVFSGTSSDSFGTAVSRHNGEDIAYTIISAPLYSAQYWRQGAVFIHEDTNETPDKTILGSGVQEQLGDNIYRCTDFDGDGAEDALISSSFFGGSLDNQEALALAGRVYVAPSQQWINGESTISSTSFTFWS